MIRSHLPLTIRGFCLCLATLGMGNRAPACRAGGTAPSHRACVWRVSYEAVRRVLRAARRRSVGRVSTDHPRGLYTARSVCAGRQSTVRVRRVLPVPVAHPHCTTAGWSPHGKHLDRGREPGGKDEQKWGGRRSYASPCRSSCSTTTKAMCFFEEDALTVG